MFLGIVFDILQLKHQIQVYLPILSQLVRSDLKVKVKYFIYLLFENLFQPMPGWHASMPRKEKREGRKERKGIEAQRVKHPTPSQATNALTGDEGQNGKQKRKRKKQGVE